MAESVPSHPRLYFHRDDIPRLREKRSSDPLASAAWARVMDRAQIGMDMQLPEWQPQWEWDKGETGQMCLGVAIEAASQYAVDLAFAFLLTEQESYARRAVELMLSTCDFDHWTSLPFFQPPYDPPWRATLETAVVSQWMGIAYNWLYDLLFPQERDCIRLNISYKGIMPLIQDWADPLCQASDCYSPQAMGEPVGELHRARGHGGPCRLWGGEDGEVGAGVGDSTA